jgi:hypothetical protein
MLALQSFAFRNRIYNELIWNKQTIGDYLPRHDSRIPGRNGKGYIGLTSHLVHVVAKSDLSTGPRCRLL